MKKFGKNKAKDSAKKKTKTAVSEGDPPKKGMGMKEKGKAKAAEAKAKAEQAMQERKEKKEAKYREGVLALPGCNPYGAVRTFVSDADFFVSDVKWAPLADWVAHESKENEGKEQSAAMQKVEAKAKKSLLGKVHNAITKKMMIICTEIGAMVMEGTEPPIRAGDDDVGALVNNMGAIVSTYHLLPVGDGTKRWSYLRRFASDKLTLTIVKILDGSPDSSKKVAEMKASISNEVKTKAADAEAMMQAKITEMMEAEADVVVPEAAGDVAAAPVDEMKAGIDEMIQSLGSAAMGVATARVDGTIAVMVDTIGVVLDALLAAYDEVKAKGGIDGDGNLNEDSVEELKEEVFKVVQTEYNNVFMKVSNQVGGFTHFLDMMMAPEGGGGGGAE